ERGRQRLELRDPVRLEALARGELNVDRRREEVPRLGPPEQIVELRVEGLEEELPGPGEGAFLGRPRLIGLADLVFPRPRPRQEAQRRGAGVAELVDRGAGAPDMGR